MTRYRSALCWFRRDLRSYDHAALQAALTASLQVHCAFVFDTEILDKLRSRRDRRVEFIHASVTELARTLQAQGGGLIVLHGRAREEIPRLAQRLGVEAVYVNRDYEPEAVARDAAVARALGAAGVAFVAGKDQVIFERDEILTQAGKTFTVFTPYRNAWLKKLSARDLRPHEIEPYRDRLARVAGVALPGWKELGFEPGDLQQAGVEPGMSGARRRYERFIAQLDRYHEQRNAVAADGTSRLSVHLRFGTISIREVARAAWLAPGPGAAAWLNELAWRDFFFMILHHYPHVVERAFRREFERACRTPTTRRCTPRGARGAPDTRWSMPACAASTRRASCITACAWSRRLSW